MKNTFNEIFNKRMSQIEENMSQSDIKGFIDQNINSILGNLAPSDKGKFIDALTHLKDVGGSLQYQPGLDIATNNQTSNTDASSSTDQPVLTKDTETEQQTDKQPSPEDMKKTTAQNAEYATAANTQNILAGYKKG